MKNVKTIIKRGDSLDVLKELKSASVDLIITSPPYADSRTGTYPDEYVDWFLPIGDELKRVLKEDGTFILNIKERVVAGERLTYVIELILALRKTGWLWTEEFMWHKKIRIRESGRTDFATRGSVCCNKSRQFNMYQEEVMVPVGEWAKSRLKNLSATDRVRDVSKVGSGFGKKIENWIDRERAYPTNVLHLATECGNKEHSAVFPEALPEWLSAKTPTSSARRHRFFLRREVLEFDVEGVHPSSRSSRARIGATADRSGR